MTGRADVDDRALTPERLLGSLLFLPLGIGARLVDELPTNIVKARQQVAFARFIGKLAVDQGAREIRRRLTAPAADIAAAPVAEPQDAPERLPAEEPPRAAATPPAADSLALPDYDQLPAAHIVGKLAGLTQTERNDIEAHELADRHRRTVLGKLAQLRTD